MNYYWVFYGISVSDGIKRVFDVSSNIFTFFTVISLIAFILVIGISADSTTKGEDRVSADNWRKFIGRTFWLSMVICIITWLGYMATPSKKDCLLIVAGGAVGNFITTDSSAKSIPSDITNFLHVSLQEQIKEVSSGAKEEVIADAKKQLDIQTPKDKMIEKVKAMTKEEIINYLQSDTTISK